MTRLHSPASSHQPHIPARIAVRWICWGVAMAIALLWCGYMFLYSEQVVPEFTRGLVGLFIIVEFTLVSAGIVVARRTHPPADLTEHLKALQEVPEAFGRLAAQLEELQLQMARLEKRNADHTRIMRRMVERIRDFMQANGNRLGKMADQLDRNNRVVEDLLAILAAERKVGDNPGDQNVFPLPSPDTMAAVERLARRAIHRGQQGEVDKGEDKKR
jgi:hypothetical protein